jgi:hypothetical protein
MNIKTLALLSALTITLFSGCSKSENDSNGDNTSSEDSKVTVSDTQGSVEEKLESTVETQEESSKATEEIFTESVEDLYLAVDKKEIKIGEDDSEVIFVARDIIEPQKVQLIDADTGEVVGEMLDDAEFEKSGDDISGDCWYSLRYKLDDTFPTDPDVSEDRKYHFYARYIDGETEHRSDVVEITVYEGFTDKELEKMEEARNRLKELRESEEYKALDDEEQKEKILECLHELEAEGIVDKDGIHMNTEENRITYYSCGIPVIIMLDPMPWEQDGGLRKSIN